MNPLVPNPKHVSFVAEDVMFGIPPDMDIYEKNQPEPSGAQRDRAIFTLNSAKIELRPKHAQRRKLFYNKH